MLEVSVFDERGDLLPKGHYYVTGGQEPHYVCLTDLTCDCADHLWRDTLCKHIKACLPKTP